MKEDPLLRCPSCGKDALARIMGGGTGLIFKGSGFYLTDYKKGNSSPSSGKETKPGKDSKSSNDEKSSKDERSSKDEKSGKDDPKSGPAKGETKSPPAGSTDKKE